MSSDQRRSLRKKTFLKGRIFFNNGASSMDCLIRDMSTTGAKLELSETTTLPEVFDLYVQNKDARYRSTIRWRRGGAMGITFDDGTRTSATEAVQPMPEQAAADASLSMLLRRIGELEAENAALRSLLTTVGRASSAA